MCLVGAPVYKQCFCLNSQLRLSSPPTAITAMPLPSRLDRSIQELCTPASAITVASYRADSRQHGVSPRAGDGAQQSERPRRASEDLANGLVSALGRSINQDAGETRRSGSCLGTAADEVDLMPGSCPLHGEPAPAGRPPGAADGAVIGVALSLRVGAHAAPRR